jgi:hypothetical protein
VLLGSNTLPAAAVQVTMSLQGRLECTYTAPDSAGLYRLEVTAGGRHVSGSPFSVRVLPASLVAAATAAVSAAATTAAVAVTAPAAIMAAAGAGGGASNGVEDWLTWWGTVAQAAYAAVDGSLEGFESLPATSVEKAGQPMLSSEEAKLVAVRTDIARHTHACVQLVCACAPRLHKEAATRICCALLCVMLMMVAYASIYTIVYT